MFNDVYVDVFNAPLLKTVRVYPGHPDRRSTSQSQKNLLQFVYIKLVASLIGTKYVVMLEDDHRDYCWFVVFPNTVTGNAATAFID